MIRIIQQRLFRLTCLVICTAIFFSCSNNEHKGSILTGVMSGYSNEDRERKYLRDNLKEISGILFLNNGQKMASVNDEEGKIFTVDFSGRDSTASFTFAPKGDFEDIVMDDKYFYVLESRGRIYRVPKPGVDDSLAIYKMDIKNADFEAMYMDSAKKRIVMICKSCPDYEKTKSKPAFCFDLTTMTFGTEPCFTIDAAKVRKLLKSDNFGVKPSAAAINPVLNKLFIVCSQDGKGLVICDLDGNVEDALFLDESMYPQPEGLTFAPNGDMYISNEGYFGLASIIHYRYKKMR